jgi:5-methylthioadenosine/S-adenosylhomocysteine deaminase
VIRSGPRLRLRVFLLALLASSPLTAQAPETADLLVRGGTVVTMDGDRRVLENGAIAIRGDRILDVGTEDELRRRYRARRAIDAAGRVVLPGLINTHTHAAMALFRGLADDLPLQEWLEKAIFPAEAKNVNEEFVRWGTRLACLEMIQGGTTAFVDMYYFESAAADETAKAGMRGILGQALIDFPAPDNKTWGEAMAATEKFLRAWKGHALVTPAVAPHATYTVSPEHLKEAHALAVRDDAPLVIHVAETQSESQTIRSKYGATPVGFLEGLGFLDGRVLIAHAIWVDDTDVATLARRQVGVAHCPQSNMKLASGTAPVPALVSAGIAVGLGTDGAASNNDLDLWEEMDTAAKLHKLISMRADALPAREAVAMATIGGARAIRRDRDLGSLEPGKLADLIVVRTDAPHQTPLYDVYSHLVYATKASDVETVVVGGRVLMENRRVQTIDAPAVLAKARQLRDQIRRSVAP